MGVFNNVIKGGVFTPLCFLLAEGARFEAPDILWLSKDPGEFIRLAVQRMLNAYQHARRSTLADWTHPFKVLHKGGFVHQVGGAATLGAVTAIANEMLKKFPKMRENALLRYSVSLLAGAGASYLVMDHLLKLGRVGPPFVDTVLSVAMVALPWKVATEALHFGSTAIGWSASLIPQICHVGQKVADVVSFPGGPHIADAKLPFGSRGQERALGAIVDVICAVQMTTVDTGASTDQVVAELLRVVPDMTREQAQKLAPLVRRREPPPPAAGGGGAGAAAAAAVAPPARRAARVDDK
jgi:hypothetical protein